MNNIENDYSNTKRIYGDIFSKAKDALNKQLGDIGKLYLCNSCTQDCGFRVNDLSLPLGTLPVGCIYRGWQQDALNKLNNEVSKDICIKLDEIEKYRSTFECVRCASCCKFACSEFSPSELKLKAQSGDSFATQFLSVFVPYDSYEEAYKIYPAYFDLLKKKYGDDEEIYFYYCPKLSKDNLCTDYDNRPQVCREFPSNPLVLLPKKCGYNLWKQEVEVVALMLHAILEISTFYQNKLGEALCNKT